MFDTAMYEAHRRSADDLAATRTQTPLATGAQLCDALRSVQAAQDVLDGIAADLLAHLDSTEGYTEEGAPTAAAWAVRELRLPVKVARRRIRAGQALQTLPILAASAAAGRVRAAHVDEFAAGITKVGADVMTDTEDLLVPIAESCDPTVVRAAINHLNEIVNPESLDNDYVKGMAKRDLKAAKCGDGYHISGFLDQLTGAQFAAWLKTKSTPINDGDDRTPADRRVDEFAQLLTTHTHADVGDDTAGAASDDRDDGAASDAGDDGGGARAAGSTEKQHAHPRRARGARRARPVAQLLVLADLATLLRHHGAEPATLAGFGHIGGQLLGYLTCTADLTGILTDGHTTGPTPQADVLNVGRTSRLATPPQRHAVLARQHGDCANPGCTLTQLEIHHVAWWDRDTGASDLDNLIGLCSRCHHLVHQNKLTIRPDEARGFIFARKNGRIVDDHTRTSKHRIRQVLTQLRHPTTDGTCGHDSSSVGGSGVGGGAAGSGQPTRQTPSQSPRPDPADPPDPSGRDPGSRHRIDPQWLTPINSAAEQVLYDHISAHTPPT